VIGTSVIDNFKFVKLNFLEKYFKKGSIISKSGICTNYLVLIYFFKIYLIDVLN